MTILTKPSTGAKLNPKAADPATVENGPIIEQVNFRHVERKKWIAIARNIIALSNVLLICIVSIVSPNQ